jgi:pimeloyl-ACP methyl ester carboxylesterase
MVVTDHIFTVPLDHSAPDGRTIEVFAREVVAAGKQDQDLPWLLFLQGGPGGKSPRPSGPDGWIGTALEDHRLLLLDQRGTGRSTPITAAKAASYANRADLAAYLKLHRADSIVADAELIRRELSPDRPWTTLGQSYGGFITLTYLSNAPHGLRRCYVTGGLPGITATADDVYANTYPLVQRKNAAYYRRYPEDVARVRRIADHLRDGDVRLPDGDPLTVDRFRHLGMVFGMGDGFERIHWLIDEAWDGEQLSLAFLYEVMAATGFAGGPLFAVLQEACYPQDSRPTAWAAQRAKNTLPAYADDAEPLLFTGEMMYPWMFRDIAVLQPFADAVELLSSATDWGRLYDADRLANNEVPIAAIVYHDDMYVPAKLSLETADRIGNIVTWVTNEWEHDGGRASGGAVLRRLIKMADDLPS